MWRKDKTCYQAAAGRRKKTAAERLTNHEKKAGRFAPLLRDDARLDEIEEGKLAPEKGCLSISLKKKLITKR